MFKININEQTIQPLKKVTFSDLNLSERYDIQEWIADNPSILGSDDLLIIDKEHILPSNIRLDLLAVDKLGRLVIIELKKDKSGRYVDLQAIKYASYCSTFTNEDIFNIFADYLHKKNSTVARDVEKAKEIILQHIDDNKMLNDTQRIILVAREFTSDVVSSVLWLRDYEVDITCVKLEPLQDTVSNTLFLDSNVIIPTPEARDYIVRKEKKEKEKQSESNFYSLYKPNYSDEELKCKLQEDLDRQSDLTERLRAFLQILLEHNEAVEREYIKEKFFTEYQIGENIGQAGRFLSNISQYLTNPHKGHLRQIIEFNSNGEIGGLKDKYRLIDEYRPLLKDLLSQ